MKNITTVILAAGKGTRLKSKTPKVLNNIKGKPSLFYSIEIAQKISNEIVVVVGYKKDEVKKRVNETFKSIDFAIQEPQNGTAHAVKIALPKVNKKYILVLSGDVPSLKFDTVYDFVDKIVSKGKKVGFIAAYIDDPAQYGRVILDNQGVPKKIVEFINCNEEEKNINLINSGVYIIEKEFIETNIFKIKENKKKGELFLPDLIEIGYQNGEVDLMILDNSKEVMGFNTKEELNLLNI